MKTNELIAYLAYLCFVALCLARLVATSRPKRFYSFFQHKEGDLSIKNPLNNTLSDRIEAPSNDQQIAMFQKEIYKLNKMAKKEKEMSDKLRDKLGNVTKEKNDLNTTLNKQIAEMEQKMDKMTKQLKEAEENGEVGGVKKRGLLQELSDQLLKMSEYHTFYESLNLQINREKELRVEVENKMKKMEQAKEKLENIYQDISINFKSKVESLTTDVEYLKKTNFELEQRVYTLQNENEKTAVTRNILRKGINADTLKDASEGTVTPKCVNSNSCSECLSDNSCVWCTVEKKCGLGDSSGPYDGSCMKSFVYMSCPDNFCGKYNECSECLDHPSCGWCDGSKKCVEGSGTGPIGVMCKKDYIHKEGSPNRCPSNLSQFARKLLSYK